MAGPGIAPEWQRAIIDDYQRTGSVVATVANMRAKGLMTTRSTVTKYVREAGVFQANPGGVRRGQNTARAEQVGGIRTPMGRAASAEIKEAVAEMRRAAVEGGYTDDESLAEVWQYEEKRAAKKIEKAKTQGVFRWRAPGPHLLLAFAADQHIGPGTPVDFGAMRKDAELIRDTQNCYVWLGGDGVDNHIKHRAAVLSARSVPEDQYKLFEYYLQILGDKALLAISGNHDNWTHQLAGVDMIGRIAQSQRVCYAPDEAFMTVDVGGVSYAVAVRHQYRMNSSFNQTHSVKQWLRLGEREFDIGCVAHHHEHAVESFMYRGQIRWACRPGSYQITSAYSRQYGYNQSMPTTPTFLLRGDRKEVVGFPSLRMAVDAVGAMREIQAA